MDLPKRKIIRLQNYDYNRVGAYFITICTYERKRIFSTINLTDDTNSVQVDLTKFGRIVENSILSIPDKYLLIVDKYVIMPDHVHLILLLKGEEYLKCRDAALDNSRSYISKAIGYKKMNTSKEIHSLGYTEKVWQRSFYDHVIRNETDRIDIYDYIESNPMSWYKKALNNTQGQNYEN